MSRSNLACLRIVKCQEIKQADDCIRFLVHFVTDSRRLVEIERSVAASKFQLGKMSCGNAR